MMESSSFHLRSTLGNEYHNHIGTETYSAGSFEKYSFTKVRWPSLKILLQLKLIRIPFGAFNSFI
jgi:hypothetical protein